MLPISRARATASLAALILAALLVLPGVALADPSTPADGSDVLTGDPEGTEDATEDGTSDGDVDAGSDTDATDEEDTTISLPTPVHEERLITACAPHLVTFTRDGIDGDDTAVALTSQAVDAARPGWLHVTWEAATGTELDAVELLHADGSRSVLAATLTGTVYDVVEVTFCGRADDTAGALEVGETAVEDAAGDADTPDADGEEATDTPRTEDAGDDAGDTPVPPPATGAGNPSAPSGNPASPAAILGNEARDDAATADDEAEVEVLGVQIVAPERDAAPEEPDETVELDDDPAVAPAAAPALADAASGSGGMHPLLLAAAIAAGLAGAVTVLRSTSRATTSSTTQGDL